MKRKEAIRRLRRDLDDILRGHIDDEPHEDIRDQYKETRRMIPGLKTIGHMIRFMDEELYLDVKSALDTLVMALVDDARVNECDRIPDHWKNT